MCNKPASGELAPKNLRVAVKALITNDHKVLLVRRSALPESAYPLDYNLPGGAVEPGESLISALKREIAEETALEISVDGILGIREWTAERHSAYYVGIFFACRLLSGDSLISLNYENSDYIWATEPDLARLKIIDSSRGILEQFFSSDSLPLLPYMPS